jgi:hypothetical protein
MQENIINSATHCGGGALDSSLQIAVKSVPRNKKKPGKKKTNKKSNQKPINKTKETK